MTKNPPNRPSTGNTKKTNMHFEINISSDAHGHLFATHPRSIVSYDDLDAVLPILKAKFPPSEGYRMIITRYEDSGTIIGETPRTRS